MRTQQSSLLIEAGQFLRDILRMGVECAEESSPRVLDGLPEAELRSRFLPFVSVHLYRVEEERTLFDPHRVPVGGTSGEPSEAAVFAGPPVYLSLHYAILPWGRDLPEQCRLLEHSIQGIMTAARSHLASPDARRDGKFRLRFTHPFDLADQTRVMNSLGLALRPIVSCSGVARLDSEVRTSIPRVRTRRLRIEEPGDLADRSGLSTALPGSQGGRHGA